MERRLDAGCAGSASCECNNAWSFGEYILIRRRLYREEHEIFRQSVRRWAETEVFPHGENWREAGVVSREVWRSAGGQGFLCMYADERYGGLALDDFRYDMIIAEEIGPREPGLIIPLHNRNVGP